MKVLIMSKAILIIVVISILNVFLQGQSTVITINLDEQFQTIDNFGASDCWSMQKIGEWHESNKIQVADLLFSVDEGIGLSAWRFNIGAGLNYSTIQNDWRTVETFETAQGVYDWTRQEEERWFLQAAKDRGVDQFIAFVNSPPARMNRNGFTNCTDGMGSTNLRNGYEGQFATYLVDVLKHFRDEWDITFDYISPVNEPQWEWNIGCNQEGNRANNEDIRNIVIALYNELQSQGVETEISIVESGDLRSWYQENNNMNTEYGGIFCNYLSELINDDNIKNKIAKHFSGHSYWSDRINGQLLEDRQPLAFRFSPFFDAEWKYWMTEYCVLDGPEGDGGHGRDLTIKTAIDVARVIHYDLTMLNANAWQWWTAVSPENYKDGLIYTDYKNNPNMQNVIESKTLWTLGNYSRYIRPGAVRIELEGADDKFGLMGSAYLNLEKNKLIIVLVNADFTNKSITFDIDGLNQNKEIKNFTPFVTSDQPDDDLKEYEIVDIDSGYYVPARSVVTLIGEISSIDTSDVDMPKDFKLFQNYPNPFNGETNINYYLKEPNKVKIEIYSMLGQKIKTLLNDNIDSGFYDNVFWDGTDCKNNKVNSGVYFCSMQVGNNSDAKKIIYLK